MMVGSGFARPSTRKSSEVLSPPYDPPDIVVIASHSDGGDKRVGAVPLRREFVRRDGRSSTVGNCPSDLTTA